ncbi:MAG: hypothetical protein WCH62_08305, partial [Candidatus Omnitrophota bacterium]
RGPPYPAKFTVIVTTEVASFGKTTEVKLVPSATGEPFIASSRINEKIVVLHPAFFDLTNENKQFKIFVHELVSHIGKGIGIEKEALAQEDTEKETNYLWASDLDGTLRVPRQKGSLSSAVIATIGEWINHFGTFCVTTDASGKELYQRTDTKIVSDLYTYLGATDQANKTIQKKVILTLSRGAEQYSINDAQAVGEAQVKFLTEKSKWISLEQAQRARQIFESNGLKVLAMDTPIGAGHENKVVAFYLVRQEPGAKAEKEAEFEVRINSSLREENLPISISWMGGNRGRFNAFPTVKDRPRTKIDGFKWVLNQSVAVNYTGDELEPIRADGSTGNDRVIAQFINKHKLGQVNQVTGIDDTLQKIRARMSQLRGHEEGLIAKPQEETENTTKHLWISGLNGVLRPLSSKGILSKEVIATIAEWITQHGRFCLVSDVSAKTLLREQLNIVGHLAEYLGAERETNNTIQKNVVFALSAGREQYRVKDAFAGIYGGRFEFMPEHSLWIPMVQAQEARRIFEENWLTVTNMDTPIGKGHEDKVVCFNLTRNDENLMMNAEVIKAKVNQQLKDASLPVSIVWVDKGLNQFRAYPTGNVSQALENSKSVKFNSLRWLINESNDFYYTTNAFSTHQVGSEDPENRIDGYMAEEKQGCVYHVTNERDAVLKIREGMKSLNSPTKTKELQAPYYLIEDVAAAYQREAAKDIELNWQELAYGRIEILKGEKLLPKQEEFMGLVVKTFLPHAPRELRKVVLTSNAALLGRS